MKPQDVRAGSHLSPNHLGPKAIADEAEPVTISPSHYRKILGRFPTGVAAITAIGDDGQLVGMAVGSFTSASLDPPLVAFLPDKTSTSFPRIREAGRFCVNFLTHDQEWLGRAFATRGTDKFAGVRWSPAPVTGSPVIDGTLGWIDCEMGDVHDAGDHYIVIGKVMSLEAAEESLPLVFFQGGFGRFSSLSLASAFDTQLLRELKHVEAARPMVEPLVAELDVECLALVRQGDEMLTLASWGSRRDNALPSRVGQRQPILPPMGSLFVAWSRQSEIDRWLDLASQDAQERGALLSAAERVRQRGWSLGLDSEGHRRYAEAVAAIDPDGPTPAQRRDMAEIALEIAAAHSEPEDLEPGGTYCVRSLSAPVFGTNGNVELMLTLFGFRDMTTEQIFDQRDRLITTADAVTEAISGRRPLPISTGGNHV